jgi:hypothetical protein
MEPFYGLTNQSDPHTVSQRWYNELERIYFHATEAQLEAHRLNPRESVILRSANSAKKAEADIADSEFG